ncbi:hypothetical protein Hypma_010532 [Hypsizygus marmoreus]|uniref:Uncharacterized protein n=1 Tax=Hypsizygus marmoreus TaxID=39966 RepID=A0A369JRT5_HYPMA|nr:hypothetical protein Hypma_010532 [Hypsizygus marmoreus]
MDNAGTAKCQNIQGMTNETAKNGPHKGCLPEWALDEFLCPLCCKANNIMPPINTNHPSALEPNAETMSAQQRSHRWEELEENRMIQW